MQGGSYRKLENGFKDMLTEDQESIRESVRVGSKRTYQLTGKKDEELLQKFKRQKQ